MNMKNKFKTIVIEQEVCTQYEDFCGIIKLDNYGDRTGDFFTMCQNHGINTDKYFLYGITLYDGSCDGICEGKYAENKGDATASVTVYLIDREIYGCSYDEIRKYQGQIQLKKATFKMAYSEWKKYIKRLSIGVVSPLSKEIDAIIPEK